DDLAGRGDAARPRADAPPPPRGARLPPLPPPAPRRSPRLLVTRPSSASARLTTRSMTPLRDNASCFSSREDGWRAGIPSGANPTSRSAPRSAGRLRRASRPAQQGGERPPSRGMEGQAEAPSLVWRARRGGMSGRQHPPPHKPARRGAPKARTTTSELKRYAFRCLSKNATQRFQASSEASFL